MKASIWRAMLTLGFWAAAPWAQAQPATAVRVGAPAPSFVAGERIRLRLASGRTYRGAFASADESSLAITSGDGFVLRVDRDQVASIDVGEARSRSMGAVRGALKGAVPLLVLGGVVYGIDQANKRPDGLCGNVSIGIQACTTGSDVASLAVGGAMIGAALGAAFPGERWIHLQPDAVRIGLGRLPGGGWAARASVSF